MNNKTVTILLPIIAIIIIFESITLVTKLENNQSSNVVNKVVETVTPTVVEENKDALDLVFATDNKDMEIGKKYTVKLQGYVKEKKIVDSLELAIKFDAKNLEVSNLVYDKNLPKPSISTVSKKDGMIVVKYLIENKSGLTLNESNIVSLLTFDVKPITVGNYNLEIATGNEGKEFATMFIENTTVKGLSFSANKLEINVVDKK